MHRLWLCALAYVFFLSQGVQAGSDIIIDDNNKDSSSFVADPDPLDPLPVKKENIKDGEEIVLDDIRQVIDQPRPAKTPQAKVQSTHRKSKSEKSTRTSKARAQKKLRSDDPDERIENRLHQEYMKFNITPTSVEQWSQATAGQKVNIYIVEKNDNLYTISRTLFGDSKFWPKIWALNRDSILNPHQIFPGMRIHFFAGTEDSVPTLSLAPSTSASEATKADDGVQNTEFGNLKLKASPRDKNLSLPAPIPDSLPMTRNSRLEINQARTQVDLRDKQYVGEFEYKNPYYLSSEELKSDFIVPGDQINDLLCRENQFIPLVTKKNDQVSSGRFAIVTPLTNESNLRKTYKYKAIGSVVINDENQMRVSDCKELMSKDTLIVSQGKLQSLNEPIETFDFSPRILDGLDFTAQTTYTDNQYLVMNLGSLNVDSGAHLNVYSDRLGKNVGRLRVMRRSGTLAIGVITDTFDIIYQGDRIVE